MQCILEEAPRVSFLQEPQAPKPDSHYGRVMEELADYENELDSVLNEEGKEIFERFNKSQIEIELLMGIDKFIDGYRLGVLVTKEAFNGNNLIR